MPIIWCKNDCIHWNTSPIKLVLTFFWCWIMTKSFWRYVYKKCQHLLCFAASNPVLFPQTRIIFHWIFHSFIGHVAQISTFPEPDVLRAASRLDQTETCWQNNITKARHTAISMRGSYKKYWLLIAQAVLYINIWLVCGLLKECSGVEERS